MKEIKKTNFTATPNIIYDDKRVTVYARSLYNVIIRTAGWDGICWKSLTTLANESGISRTLVIKSKKELEEFGYITIGDYQDGSVLRHGIKLVDIWERNAKYKMSQSIFGLY